jgi:hypothetical protein
VRGGTTSHAGRCFVSLGDRGAVDGEHEVRDRLLLPRGHARLDVPPRVGVPVEPLAPEQEDDHPRPEPDEGAVAPLLRTPPGVGVVGLPLAIVVDRGLVLEDVRVDVGEGVAIAGERGHDAAGG